MNPAMTNPPSDNGGEGKIFDCPLPDHLVWMLARQDYHGRMTDPDGAARIKGLCGDHMEFFLLIDGQQVKTVRYLTDGCLYTQICAVAAAHLAQGRTISELLSISPQQIIALVGCLPDHHRHCAILAVSTLHKAVADFWLAASG